MAIVASRQIAALPCVFAQALSNRDAVTQMKEAAVMYCWVLRMELRRRGGAIRFTGYNALKGVGGNMNK